MNVAPASRVNYFDRQFIRLSELRDEQAYHLELRRRHHLSHHSWGIVLGLEIVKQDDGRPAVQPGLAVDGYGRELLLVDRTVLGRDKFDTHVTSRLDVWLEYDLELADDRLAPIECGEADPRRKYRAIERARIAFTRGGARPDPRRPDGVPLEALAEPLLATPDDPRQRWPVYLGRVVMDLPASGVPGFTIDTADRPYVGLNAEIIDHPGNATRIELGRRPQNNEQRTVDGRDIEYERDGNRDFAIFVPSSGPPPPDPLKPVLLHPTIAVTTEDTEIRGDTKVHGNLILDGASLQFPEAITDGEVDTHQNPAIYRATDLQGDDELRIDLGSLDGGPRRLVIGVTKNGEFHPALEVSYPVDVPNKPQALVTIHGDLRIEGLIDADDMRVRTVTEDVAALLTGMVQAGVVSGG